MIDWGRYEQGRKGIDAKKRKIKDRGAKDTLEALILQGLISSEPEPEEWAIAFAEHFEENPDDWEESQSAIPDPPKLRAFKDKIENFLDLFGKVRRSSL